MKTTIRAALALAILAAVILVTYPLLTQSGVSAKHVGAVETGRPQTGSVSLACPGRIEGLSDSTDIGAATDGVIQAIHVKEGQRVLQGDMLAEIGCSDLASALRVVNAEADSLRQARVRLLRGSRDEERLSAAQKTAAARAVVGQAAANLARMQQLWDASTISKAAFEQAQRDYDVAQAEFKQAGRNEELVNAGPLSEEVARADADVRAAEDRIKQAEDKLAKCAVRAPMNGTILRVHLREGESFSTFAPRPLFSIADLSGRRVRAEVDERDVGSVQVGQKVLVSSDAYSSAHYAGKVIKLATTMGRKSISTGNPVSKEDRDILEVTAQLESGAVTLPVGLRVTVQFVR
jgi:HlyD family secretion protein